jgi:hypothetical protein
MIWPVTNKRRLSASHLGSLKCDTGSAHWPWIRLDQKSKNPQGQRSQSRWRRNPLGLASIQVTLDSAVWQLLSQISQQAACVSTQGLSLGKLYIWLEVKLRYERYHPPRIQRKSATQMPDSQSIWRISLFLKSSLSAR